MRDELHHKSSRKPKPLDSLLLINKSRTANAVRLLLFVGNGLCAVPQNRFEWNGTQAVPYELKIGNKLSIRGLVLLDEALQIVQIHPA